MKRITVKDIEKLHNLYLNGDYNSLKVVWSQLNEALDWIDLHASLILEESKMTEQNIIEDKEQLLKWVQQSFPNVYPEIRKGKSSVLNNDENFPKFKQQEVAIES